MSIEPADKTPTEWLTHQTELLEQIVAAQQQIMRNQHKNSDDQIDWLESINEQAKIQTGFLKNINTVATLLGVLLLLSICGWLYILVFGL